MKLGDISIHWEISLSFLLIPLVFLPSVIFSSQPQLPSLTIIFYNPHPAFVFALNSWTPPNHTEGLACAGPAEAVTLAWVRECGRKGVRGWVFFLGFTHLFRQRGAGVLRKG